MLSDDQILHAIERLRDEWPALLGDDAAALTEWLAATPRDDAEAVRRTVNRVLSLLERHPQARERLNRELGLAGERGPITKGPYEPPPAGPGPIPATTWLVCPVDPGHCRRQQRQLGQRLFCSEHPGVELVPEDALPPKE